MNGHPITNIYSSETTSIFDIISKISEIEPQEGDNWNVTNIIGLYESAYFTNNEKKLLNYLYNEPRFIVHCVQSNSDTKAVLASNIQNYTNVTLKTVPTNRFINIYITDQNDNLIDIFNDNKEMLEWYVGWFIRIDFVYELF
jgi:hypothetical protein